MRAILRQRDPARCLLNGHKWKAASRPLSIPTSGTIYLVKRACARCGQPDYVRNR